VLFLLAIVLSVLLRYTDSDYPFGVFKLFLASPIRSTIATLSTTLAIVHEEEQTTQWQKEKAQKDKKNPNDLQNIHIKLKIE
jgi:hypothetical protein